MRLLAARLLPIWLRRQCQRARRLPSAYRCHATSRRSTARKLRSLAAERIHYTHAAAVADGHAPIIRFTVPSLAQSISRFDTPLVVTVGKAAAVESAAHGSSL